MSFAITTFFFLDNLADWEFQGDFWAPDLFTMHEMPDLFKMGDWWYLITTEYSPEQQKQSIEIYEQQLVTYRETLADWQLPEE